MSNVNVQTVYITKEVADKLEINPAYLIRVAKKLLEEGAITKQDIRMAGKRNYIFNDRAVEVIKDSLNK